MRQTGDAPVRSGRALEVERNPDDEAPKAGMAFKRSALPLPTTAALDDARADARVGEDGVEEDDDVARVGR